MPVYPAREMPDKGGADRTFAVAGNPVRPAACCALASGFESRNRSTRFFSCLSARVENARAARAVSLFGREDDDLAVLVDRRYKYIQPPATLT